MILTLPFFLGVRLCSLDVLDLILKPTHESKYLPAAQFAMCWPNRLAPPLLIKCLEVNLKAQLRSDPARPYLNRICSIGSYRCILD
jgi:hypothetical protein